MLSPAWTSFRSLRQLNMAIQNNACLMWVWCSIKSSEPFMGMDIGWLRVATSAATLARVARILHHHPSGFRQLAATKGSLHPTVQRDARCDATNGHVVVGGVRRLPRCPLAAMLVARRDEGSILLVAQHCAAEHRELERAMGVDIRRRRA